MPLNEAFTEDTSLMCVDTLIGNHEEFQKDLHLMSNKMLFLLWTSSSPISSLGGLPTTIRSASKDWVRNVQNSINGVWGHCVQLPLLKTCETCRAASIV